MKLNEETKKESPFRVPDGYFENLTERTMSAVKAGSEDETGAEEKPVRRLSLRTFMAAAAVLALVAVITTVTLRLVPGDRKGTVDIAENGFYPDLAAEEIDLYIIESEWDLEDAPGIPEKERSISSEAIIDYLMMENIDINDIYELL